MNCKLAERKQLAAQGVSGRQVHKGVAGGSQRRGSVASPVMIDRSRNAAGNHPLSAGSPRQGATHYLQVVYSCALSEFWDRAHYPRYSTIRGNFQIVAIYKDFKEISSDNVTTILESPATDSPFSVLQNFPFAERTISRSNPGYACSQSPVKAQRTVRS